MLHSIKRLSAIIAATSLVLLGLNAAPSVAAPYSGAHIELVTPYLDATNTSEAAKNQALAETWVLNKWFGEGLKFQRAFAPVGSRIVLTYKVTDANGAPLVGESVILRMNKQYSGSVAQIVVDGVRAKAATSSADGARVTHVTDQFGYVTFVVQNLDTDGEQKPASFTDAPTISPDGLDDIHAQFLPQVMNEPEDHSVITEFHFYNDSAAAPSMTAPTMRLVAPALNDNNSIHRTDLETSLAANYAAGLKVRQVYAGVGSTNSLVYHVTDDAGKPAAKQDVTLHVGKANSGSNAKLSDTTYGANNTPTNVANTTTDQASWTGTTDAFGNVVFTMKNTDTTGEDFPATPTTAVPTSNAKFAQLWMSIAGAKDIGDLVEFHFTNPKKVAPTAKTAAAISGTAKVGKSLTAKATFAGYPGATATYQWYRCTVADTKTTTAAPASSAKCAKITTGKAASYKPVAADKGKYLRVLITGKNAVGTGLSLSKTTAKIG